jgi:hypothetical protein
MYTIEVIPHNTVSKELLTRIIAIKSVAWPYPFDKQLSWIETHLSTYDVHVLLYQAENPVAYLNLVRIEFLTDGTSISAWGIGNVCAAEKGKGYGKILMEQLNQFLLQNKVPGLLFCKKALVGFYQSVGWILPDPSKVSLSFPKLEIETMTFNLLDHYNRLEYNGKIF